MSESGDWRTYQFTIGMPHMSPGKLSEVELLKLIGAYQWETISECFGQRANEIMNNLNERLYASFINVELNFGQNHSLDYFDEGSRVVLQNKIATYGKSIFEGMFLFHSQDIPDALLKQTRTVKELRSLDVPWAYVTNAFIAPLGGNSKLKVFEPINVDYSKIPKLDQHPEGVREQMQVQSSGKIDGFGDTVQSRLQPVSRDPILYKIVPESDLNGAGLLYFARYAAMMNYGERVFLNESIHPPMSSHLINFFSTDRRRIYYFSNADPFDSVDISVSADILKPTSAPSPASKYATILKMQFRIDLYRHSDKVLMASSIVKKSLNVPRHIKSLLMEGERFLNQLN